MLGAVVLAARAKERFTAAERTLIDTVLCYLTAAYERRELTRHRRTAQSERKREFLTVLAHELRNPLAPLRNALEIIRSNDRARSPVEHSAYAMIERQLQQIGRLGGRSAGRQSGRAGARRARKQRVLLDAIIEHAAEQSRPWIEAARHTLVVDLPREAIALDADPKRLARVFSNLVNNAARRMDRGGRIVHLGRERRRRADGVRASARADRAGESLNDDLRRRLRASSEIADGRSQGGFTAGMTLVKHLVEMHGGSVNGDTTRPKASPSLRFAYLSPVRTSLQPRKAAHAASAEVAAERPTPHRILIADDNADSAESMGMLLRLMGNDVRIASDGLDAVEQAAAFQPDIVLHGHRHAAAWTATRLRGAFAIRNGVATRCSSP